MSDAVTRRREESRARDPVERRTALLPSRMHPLAESDRAAHLRWLLELTQVPTAAGREQRVVAWVDRWLAERPDLACSFDPSGNITITLRDAPRTDAPLYLTAHLDHPAFVVERIVAPGVVELAFRGGVMDDYFDSARVNAHAADDRSFGACLAERVDGASPFFKTYLAEFDDGDAATLALRPGDVAVWSLPPAEVAERDGVRCVLTHACDDLAALGAALAALDVLRSARAAGEPVGDVRLLLTRAEEIGFVGAIAACRHGTIGAGARLIALENSRSFPDSPIGGGPIVRVGDRVSVFTPELTAAVAKVAEELAGGPAQPLATQKQADLPAWRWQRKLMAGGACEASVFCASGLASTCVCLPLGNYHNMADLAAVQAGTNAAPPRIAREYIALADYEGLVDLLVACGRRLAGPEGATLGSASFRQRLDKLWNDLRFVLE